MNGWKHQLRPAYGPTVVNGFGEGERRARAVVNVAFSLTRDHLTAALLHSLSGFEPDANPDYLTDVEVREHVEAYIGLVGTAGLDSAATVLWLGYSAKSARERAHLRAVLLAVQRAYPPEAFGTVLLSGSTRRPSLRCTVRGCQWSLAEGQFERLLQLGVEHGATHQELEP